MSKTAKVTCGPMYKEGLEKYAGTEPVSQHCFAAGFVSGQAEKVYLGACSMAMFRPSQDRSGMIEQILDDVCPRYGLAWRKIEGEYWITREGCEHRFGHLEAFPLRPNINGPEWRHRFRGLLCGVPDCEIDEKFHERKGAGERCD